MAENSSIEWTDTTWNPVTGCTKISAGCDNCYAARFSERFRGVPGHPFETGFDLTLRPEWLVAAARLEAPADDFCELDERSLSEGDPNVAHLGWCSTRWKKQIGNIYQVLTKRTPFCRNSSMTAT